MLFFENNLRNISKMRKGTSFFRNTLPRPLVFERLRVIRYAIDDSLFDAQEKGAGDE